MHLAAQHRYFICEVESISGVRGRGPAAFDHIVQALLARWPLPAFASRAFTDGTRNANRAERIALFLEGERMGHCVWGAVEVNVAEGEVVHVRGRGDRDPRDVELAVLTRWAAANNLRVMLSDR